MQKSRPRDEVCLAEVQTAYGNEALLDGADNLWKRDLSDGGAYSLWKRGLLDGGADSLWKRGLLDGSADNLWKCRLVSIYFLFLASPLSFYLIPQFYPLTSF